MGLIYGMFWIIGALIYVGIQAHKEYPGALSFIGLLLLGIFMPAYSIAPIVIGIEYKDPGQIVLGLIMSAVTAGGAFYLYQNIKMNEIAEAKQRYKIRKEAYDEAMALPPPDVSEYRDRTYKTYIEQGKDLEREWRRRQWVRLTDLKTKQQGLTSTYIFIPQFKESKEIYFQKVWEEPDEHGKTQITENRN